MDSPHPRHARPSGRFLPAFLRAHDLHRSEHHRRGLLPLLAGMSLSQAQHLLPFSTSNLLPQVGHAPEVLAHLPGSLYSPVNCPVHWRIVNFVKRTITEGVPADWRSWNGCHARRCLARGKFLLVVETSPSARRDAYTMRFLYCARHVPWRKVGQAPPRPSESAITAQEAADIIGIPIMTLHKWRARNKGPACTKDQNRYWYHRDEVTTYAVAYQVVNS